MITVMGATGRTGNAITRRLLDAGEEVRALGRSETKLAELESAGAQPRVGDVADQAFLADAFAGADAVYTLLPHDPRSAHYHAEQDRQGEAIVAAVRAAGVPHAVCLSSVGAELPSGTGFIASLHAQEKRLRALEDTSVLVLRAGSFFENLYEAVEVIRHEGVNADAVAPDAAIPMIATRDIAEVAAGALRARDWRGFVVRELLGQRDLSYAEATRIIGERIAMPALEYVQLSEAQMAGALTQMGISKSFAALHVEFARAVSDGRIRSREGRTLENTTPTRFEDFADELAQAYLAAA